MQLPPTKNLKDLLEGMLGREVDLDPAAEPLTALDTVGSLIATYRDDDNGVRALLGWSLAAGAHVGASIGLLPVPLATEMVADQSLRADVVDNLAEVSNVMAALFDLPGNPHVRMVDRFQPAARAPSHLTAVLYHHLDRIDLDVSVKGYGAGKLALVSCG